MKIEENYQEAKHLYYVEQEYDFLKWGAAITLAFLVGYSIIPWWILLITYPSLLMDIKMFINKKYSIRSDEKLSRDFVKIRLTKMVKKDSIFKLTINDNTLYNWNGIHPVGQT